MLARPVKHKQTWISDIGDATFFPSPVLFLTLSSQEKRGVVNTAGHQLLLNCLETLQRALKGENVHTADDLTGLLNSLEKKVLLFNFFLLTFGFILFYVVIDDAVVL